MWWRELFERPSGLRHGIVVQQVLDAVLEGECEEPTVAIRAELISCSGSLFDRELPRTQVTCHDGAFQVYASDGLRILRLLMVSQHRIEERLGLDEALLVDQERSFQGEGLGTGTAASYALAEVVLRNPKRAFGLGEVPEDPMSVPQVGIRCWSCSRSFFRRSACFSA
jgi:hypothetical protein